MNNRKNSLYTTPYSCACCKKCWINPVTLNCEYGGPFYGYERTDDVPAASLTELLAKCDPIAPINPEDRQWAGDPPVGDELI